jgi:NADP-dependent 3-hydroxy acid dehydrogenase YdfG
MRLSDGIAAIVTGAASGLGAETAARLIQAGAKVALLDLNVEAVKSTAARVGWSRIQMRRNGSG